MIMELLLLALALALAEEPERGVVEEAQQLNVELEELLIHLRSLPAPAPTQDIESDETEPPDTTPITAETATTVSSQF
jgi:hypothetical protein